MSEVVLDARVSRPKVAPLPQLGFTMRLQKVGLNPTCTVLDAIFPNAVMFSAVTGLGSVAITDPDRPLTPTLLSVPGVRRLFNCYTH